MKKVKELHFYNFQIASDAIVLPPLYQMSLSSTAKDKK